MTRLVIVPFEPQPDKVRDDLVEEGKRVVRFVEEGAETFEIQFAMNR